MTDTNDTLYITRNDAYDDVANDVKNFVVSKDFTSGWTGTFTVRHRVTGIILIAKDVVVASATSITVTLLSSETACCDLVSAEDFGPHPFDVQMRSGVSRQTIAAGVAIIASDQTQS